VHRSVRGAWRHDRLSFRDKHLPHWEGMERERTFALEGTERRYAGPLPNFGWGDGEVVWKRLN
jgi:hypothetical protein